MAPLSPCPSGCDCAEPEETNNIRLCSRARTPWTELRLARPVLPPRGIFVVVFFWTPAEEEGWLERYSSFLGRGKRQRERERELHHHHLPAQRRVHPFFYWAFGSPESRTHETSRHHQQSIPSPPPPPPYITSPGPSRRIRDAHLPLLHRITYTTILIDHTDDCL